jgi:hypothetical protein
MRRWTSIVVLVLVILGGIAIGVSAYHAGVNHGLVQAGHATQVVRVMGPGFGFPFGLILFPLFFFLILALVRGAFWGRRWGGSGHEHAGPWSKGGPTRFEEWHRRQHEEGAGDRPGGSGEPAQV